jgi:hypothetical protein
MQRPAMFLALVGVLPSQLLELRKPESGFNMNDVFKDLYSSMKGKKSVFNFLSDEDFENLSAFLKARISRQVRQSGKKKTLSII